VRQTLAAVTTPERLALYDRTLRTLVSQCNGAKRPSGLEDFCREQAELVLQFPDCDAACRALARSLTASAR